MTQEFALVASEQPETHGSSPCLGKGSQPARNIRSTCDSRRDGTQAFLMAPSDPLKGS